MPTKFQRPKARVYHNVWGNYVCYIGRGSVNVYGSEFNAKLWLATTISLGFEVAPSSIFKEADVQEFFQFVDTEPQI